MVYRHFAGIDFDLGALDLRIQPHHALILVFQYSAVIRRKLFSTSTSSQKSHLFIDCKINSSSIKMIAPISFPKSPSTAADPFDEVNDLYQAQTQAQSGLPAPQAER
jgi:hypothetical protein